MAAEHRVLALAEVIAHRADRRTSVKKLAASEKCTAAPPSARSRSPKGVLIASKAIDPTTCQRHRRRGGYSVPRMRAVQIEEFGGPEVLQVVDLPEARAGRRGRC